jgi:hypothetical protein
VSAPAGAVGYMRVFGGFLTPFARHELALFNHDRNIVVLP